MPRPSPSELEARFRAVLARARIDGAETVVDDMIAFLPTYHDRAAMRAMRAATDDSREDLELFYGPVFRAVRAKHPRWLYGINDESVAEELLADADKPIYPDFDTLALVDTFIAMDKATTQSERAALLRRAREVAGENPDAKRMIERQLGIGSHDALDGADGE